jgi:hypothetical protein
MNEQPEALLALADRIDEAQGKPIAIDTQAAAELRHLRQVNAELLEALKSIMADMDSDFGTNYDYESARAVIARVEGD